MIASELKLWLGVTVGIVGFIAMLLATGELLRAAINIVHFSKRRPPTLDVLRL